MIANLKNAVAVFVLFLFISFHLVEASDMKLPLEGGYSYQLTVGYNGKSIFTNKNGTPYVDKWHQGDHYYALDFDNPVNRPNPNIVTIMDGEVVAVKFKAGLNGYDTDGYGNYVKVKHFNGDISLYAHLREIYVTEKEKITQGQALGIMGTTGNSTGVHLHFELKDSNGKSKVPVPMSGYTDFTEGQVYISDNHYVRFNFNDGTSQGWSAGRDTQYVQTVPNVWIVQVVDTDKDGVINPGVLSPVFGEGVTADRFPKLKFIVKVNTQPLGIQQGDIWIETPDGNWNHQFTFTQIADNGNGFHTYQAQLAKELIINRFSIELTKDSADEKWEFDEIELIGKLSAPSGLTVK